MTDQEKPRCPYGKVQMDADRAQKVAMRPRRESRKAKPYRCNACGWWHLAGIGKGMRRPRQPHQQRKGGGRG
jgi:hypothetical protein